MEINLGAFADSVKNGYTWAILGLALGFGVLGGLAHKLTSPPEDKKSLWVYIVVGGVASLAVLYIFSPQDAIKLIALSLAAGYGGKAVLDALEARVKAALASAETAKAKEAGQTTADTGKQVLSIAQNLARKNDALEKTLMAAKGQSRVEILASLKTGLPSEIHAFAAETPDSITDKLKELSNKLDFLGKSFTK